MTERYHDLARVELGGAHARPLISLMQSRGFALPLDLNMVERHPLGSQAFYPLSTNPFLVVVAPDEGGTPGTPRAFVAGPGQGVNIAMNTWHGVLTPLGTRRRFPRASTAAATATISRNISSPSLGSSSSA